MTRANGKKMFFTNLFLALTLLLPSLGLGAERWMTGDFHQHSYFTDGSWPMNDLDSSGQPVTSPQEVLPNGYTQGVLPTGYRYGLDFQANSEHGGRFSRDGFGKNWSTYSPNPIIGDDATSGLMWRWQSLISPMEDIPGYAGAPYLGAYDWIQGVRKNYPDRITMTGMEWNMPGHEHCSTGIIAENSLPIAEFEYRFDNSDTDGTKTSVTAATMGWSGKKQNSAYTVAIPNWG